MTLFTPPKFTVAEIEGARKIRSRMKKYIPSELDSDFFLARWWKTYNGDIKLIEKKMKELFDHRKLIGYDRIDTEQLEFELDIACKTFERFSISPVACSRYSGNVSVHVQRMSGTDLKEILKALPISYVLHSYFILQESFTRSVLRKEAETGAPAACASILDLEGLCLSDFINPLSGPTRLARLVVKIWADYFKEGLVKLVLINPPALLNVIWQIARLIMDKNMLSRIIILEHPSDLLKYFYPEHLYAVPESYGGQWREDNGRAEPPESACRQARQVTPQQYYNPEQLWRDHGYITVPETISTSLKGKQNLEVVKKCEKDGQALLWQFMVNGDIEFDIIRIENADKVTVWPKLTLTTIKTPEQGFIRCRKGEYYVRFTNPANSWIPLKLHYVVEMGPY